MTTDTAHLAGELSFPQDLGRLADDFDNGTTQLRDVGRMLTAQRDAILEAFENNTIAELATGYPELLSLPVANLHARVVAGEADQPIGHNFFVNAKGFLNAQLPWAHQFNDLIQARTGASLYDISQSNDAAGKDRLLAGITNTPDSELTTALAVYLAGRSREGERYLTQQYGEILQRTKVEVYATTLKIGATTGLRVDMIGRAAGQLHRATFGSLDHLDGLVTSQNTGAAGDYRIGSLRIEVQFDGNVQSAELRSKADAHHIIAHELQHAGSAQAGLRCGLQASGEGLEANEGMTEYLAQLSIGSPGIERTADGRSQVRRGVPYRVPVFAMMALHEQFKAGKNHHFATLFNAYHGDTRNTAQLEQALDVFYQHDATIARQLTNQ
jgi:hypothetical protein